LGSRTILAVGSNNARRGEQQRKRATPVVFVVHLKHGAVCRLLQLQKQNNLVFRSVRCCGRCSTQDEPATLLSPLRIVLVNLSLLSHRGLLFARHRQSALPLQAALFVGTLALPTGDTGRWSRRAK
jgi:hypothetical protein